MTNPSRGVDAADGPSDGDGISVSIRSVTPSIGGDEGRQGLIKTGVTGDGSEYPSAWMPQVPSADSRELERRAPAVPPIAGGLDEMLLMLRQVQRCSGDLQLTSVDGDDGSSPAIEGDLDFCDLDVTQSSWDRGGKWQRIATMPAARSPLGVEIGKSRSAKAIMGSPRTADSTEPRLAASASISGCELARGGHQANVTAGLGKSAHAGIPPVPRGRSQRAGPESRQESVGRGHGAGAAPVASWKAAAHWSGATGVPGLLRKPSWCRSSSGLLDGALTDPFYDIPGRYARMDQPPTDSGKCRMLTGIGNGIQMELVTTDSTHTMAPPHWSLDRSVSNSGRTGLASLESFLQYDVEDQEVSLSPSTVADSGKATATASPTPRSESTPIQRYTPLVFKNGAQARLGLNLEAVQRAREEGPGGVELDSARNSRNRRPGSSSLSGESSDVPQGTHKVSRRRLRETRHARTLSDPTTVRSPRAPQRQEERADSATETVFPSWPKSNEKGLRHSVDERFETVQSWPMEINSYPPSEARYAHPLATGWQPKCTVQISQQQQCKVYEASLGLQPVRNINRNSITISGPLPEGSVVGSETGLFQKVDRRGARVRRLLGWLFWCRCCGRKNQGTAGEDEKVTSSIFYEGVDEGACKTAGSGISTAGYARRQKFMMRMIEESRLE